LEREDHYIKLQPTVVTDRCVLLNWLIHCFVCWKRNWTWYQCTYLYIARF